MSLSGAQIKEIQKELLDAFDEAGLRQMVKFELDEDLRTIAGGENLEECTFNLVTWADKKGRTWDLIEGACASTPTSATLQALKDAAQTWHLEAPEEEDAPYQGLNFFDTVDHDRFFGRKALTLDLVNYLQTSRFLAVIGASGCGKSSIVRAGIIPKIQGNNRLLIALINTPTARPLETLATALVPKEDRQIAVTNLMDDMLSDARCLHLYIRRMLAGDGAHDHLLLVIDQFEELFTACRDRDKQRSFVDNLLTAAAPDGVTTVIITLRADFYAHCADFASLRTALENNQRYIGAMSEDELRETIEEPAERGNWILEPGLVETILDDVADEPGALPLLSHALLETWKRRSRRTLTVAGYYEAGRVQGAIANTANSVYSNLDAGEQTIARNIFLRLTELGEGVQDTRRRVPLQELVPSADATSTVEGVLQKLQNKRLVTTVRKEQPETDEDGVSEFDAEDLTIFVDVTHEALIREWPTLRGWLEDGREGLRIHHKLTEAVHEWRLLNDDPGALYRGVRLEQALEWAEEYDENLNEAERAFLVASQAQVEARRREQARVETEREEARRRELAQAQALAAEEARARNRLRWLLIAAGLALIFAVAVALYILRQNDELATERENAQSAEAAAVAGEIVADNARATAEANVGLAQQQLQELEGLSLLEQARSARKARDVDAAIKMFEAAASADPTLGIDVVNEISETLRYAAIQLVYEGEALAVQEDWAGAAEKFEAALVLDSPSDTPVYVLIPKGDFLMGSADGERLAWDDEKPQHRVSLDSYWIQRTEVTNEQYKRCVEAGKCTSPSNGRWDRDAYAREPVTDVDWKQASAYATWVGGSLPTEAQWERACRGDDGAVYPWGDDPPDPTRLNYKVSGLNGVVPVGSYPAGAGQLFDMAGNVWEWTADWYAADFYDNSPRHNPTGPETGETHTLRGGGWGHTDNVYCADRNPAGSPDDRNKDDGFRVVSGF